jgi:hypothetical protein
MDRNLFCQYFYELRKNRGASKSFGGSPVPLREKIPFALKLGVFPCGVSPSAPRPAARSSYVVSSVTNERYLLSEKKELFKKETATFSLLRNGGEIPSGNYIPRNT